MDGGAAVTTKAYFVWGLSLFAIGCAAPQDAKSDAGELLLETTCEVGNSTTDCQMWGPSIAALIARPEVFDGKAVRIIGFINFEFEGDAIYLSKGDWEHSINRNALWVELSEETVGRSFVGGRDGRPNKRYVIIEGTFRAKNRGHLGLFSGAIEQVTRLQPWNFPRKEL